MVYTLMTTHWGLPAPNLVVSVVGGEGRTKLKTWVREVIRQGLVKASQSTGEHRAADYLKRVTSMDICVRRLMHNMLTQLWILVKVDAETETCFVGSYQRVIQTHICF